MELRTSFLSSDPAGFNSSNNQLSSSTTGSATQGTPSTALFHNLYVGDTWPMLEGITHFPPPAYPVVPDEPLQMLHLRFPTPPITPPYAAETTATATIPEKDTTPTVKLGFELPSQLRTQTVIMKISAQDSYSPQTPHYEDSDMPEIDIVNLDSEDHAEHSVGVDSRLREHLITPSVAALNSSSPISMNSSPKRGEYVCEWLDCGKDHHSLDALAAHVTKVHAVASPADGLYYCRWRACTRARGFSARYKMLVHARTHTKEKPHQCHLCSKCFSRAENLKIHIRSHSGEKPYICTYEGCHKAYSNSSDRFKHTRTHAMDKPYMCKVPGCQKRYTDPSSLRKHVKTFKHAVQLIGTAALTPNSNSNAKTSNASIALSSNVTPEYNSRTHTQDTLLRSGYQSYTDVDMTAATASLPVPLSVAVPVPMALCQLCVQPHYYLHGMEEDFCHIKEATKLDYYYAAHVQTTPPRSNSAIGYCLPQAQLNTGAASPMDLETPLDLRMHKS